MSKPILLLHEIRQSTCLFRLGQALLSWGKEALDILLPQICILCQDEEGPFHAHHLCEPCFLHVYQPERFYLQGDVSKSHSAFTLGCYEAGLRRLIHRAKFKTDLAAAECLVALTQMALSQFLPQVDAATTIPGHRWRNFRRGWDLPWVIGAKAAKVLEDPLDGNLLKRSKRRPHQTGLPRSDRFRNVQGAFSAREGALGMDILVVDDVTTSGATALEAARALKAKGAKSVTFFFLARVP